MSPESTNFDKLIMHQSEINRLIFVNARNGYILYKGDCYYIIKDKNNESYVKIDCCEIPVNNETIDELFEKAINFF